MLATTHRAYQFILGALSILLFLFIVFSRFMPARETIRFLAALPFIFFVPGLLVSVPIIRVDHAIERITMSVICSLALTHTSLFLLERMTKKLTPESVAFTLLAMNGLAGSFFVMSWYVRKRRASRATAASKQRRPSQQWAQRTPR